jgi:hypothetical protein
MEPRVEAEQGTVRRPETDEDERVPAVVEEETGGGRPRFIPGRMSWSAVFAGTLIALGVWFLLHLIGTGIGLAAVDPQDPGTLRGVGIGTGIWGVIAALLALFAGGFAAGRVSGVLTRIGAGIQGAVLWALTTFVALLVVIWMVSTVIGGAVGLGATAARTVVEAGPQIVGAMDGDALDALGIDADQLLAPVNERLRAEGLPPVTAEELEAATQDAVAMAIREGRVDRQVFVQSLSENTEMSPAEAQQVAAQIEQRVDEQVAALGPRLEQAQVAALRAVEATGRAMIWMFFAFLLGLAAAVAGTVLGAWTEQRRAARAPGPSPVHT